MVNFFKNLFRGHNHDDYHDQQMQQHMQMQMMMQQQAMMMEHQQQMFNPQQQQFQQQQYLPHQYSEPFPGQQQQQFAPQQQPGGQPAPLLNHNLQIPPQQLADMQRAGGYVAVGPDGNPMIWYPNGFPGAAPGQQQAPAPAAVVTQASLPPAHLQQPQVYAPPAAAAAAQYQQQQYYQQQQQRAQYQQPQPQQQSGIYTPAGIAPSSIRQQEIQRVGPHETLIRTSLAAPPQPVPTTPAKPTKFITIKPDGTRITTTVTERSAGSNSTSIAPGAVPNPQPFRNSASIPQLVSAPHPDIAGALPAARGPASYPALDPAALHHQQQQQQQQDAWQRYQAAKPVVDINAAAAYAVAATAGGPVSPATSSATPSRNVSPADGVAAAQFAQFNQSPPTVIRA